MDLMVRHKQQLGSILILTLLMLLFLQYMAATVVNSTNISSQIVANFQRGKQLKKIAITAINIVINNQDYFDNYSKYLNSQGEFSTNLTAITVSGLKVRIIDFKCLDLAPIQNHKDCDLTNKYWQLTIQVEDFNSNTSLRVVQGLYLKHLSIKKPNHVLQDWQKIRFKKLWWYEIEGS